MHSLLIVAVLSVAQQRPWSLDVAKIGADAKAKKVSWILLMNVDAPSMAAQDRDNTDNPPPEFKSVEPRLANCEQLMPFGKAGRVAALRRGDKSAAGLLAEVAIGYPQSFYIVVFNADAEVLGAIQPENTESRGVEHFDPALRTLVKWLPEALKREDSIETLKREFQKGTKEEYFAATLLDRYREMQAIAKLAPIANAVAANESLPAAARDLADLYGFLSATLRRWGPTVRAPERKVLVEQAERVLVHTPRHKRIREVSQAVCGVVLSHAFDVPTRAGDFMKRLSDAASTSPDPNAVKDHVKLIAADLNDWRKQAKGPRGNPFYDVALFGDAAGTIRKFEDPQFAAHEMYQEWVADAKLKIAGKKP